MFVGLDGEAIGFLFQMNKTRKKINARLKIVGATLTAIFSLFSVFTATIAWFASNSVVNASAGTISIKAPDGINFDLYYLDHFAIDQSTNKDGNYNTSISVYSGYENAASNAVFEKVLYDDDGVVVDDQGNPLANDQNPTMINHLWPAHRLTYAIVINGGNVQGFSLDSWGEETNNDVKTKDDGDNDVLVSLSWAINIYGGAYIVNSTNDLIADIATGFTSYQAATLTDVFDYSQASPAANPHPNIPIISSMSGGSQNQITIIYFSIEFSNDSSTFYSLNKETGYYTKNTAGNSNCYESLTLKDLVFRLA